MQGNHSPLTAPPSMNRLLLRGLLPVLLSMLLSAPGLAGQAPAPVTRDPIAIDRAAATITEQDLRRRIGVIAHDSMRGRYTPSPELEKTAEWIAGEFQRLGLRPGGDDGSFLQRYSIRRVALDPGRSGGRFGRLDIRYGRDFGPAMALIPPANSLTGPLVIVSGSADAEAVLSSVSFTGKHVLIIPALGLDTRDPEVRSVMRAVLGRDPLGIWVPIEEENRDWVARVNAELRREHLHVGEPTTMPAFVVRDIAIARTLRGVGLDLLALRARADEIDARIEAGDELGRTRSCRCTKRPNSWSR